MCLAQAKGRQQVTAAFYVKSGEDRIPCRRFSQVEPRQQFRQKRLDLKAFSYQWLSVADSRKTAVMGIAASTLLAHSSSQNAEGGAL